VPGAALLAPGLLHRGGGLRRSGRLAIQAARCQPAGAPGDAWEKLLSPRQRHPRHRIDGSVASSHGHSGAGMAVDLASPIRGPPRQAAARCRWSNPALARLMRQPGRRWQPSGAHPFRRNGVWPARYAGRAWL